MLSPHADARLQAAPTRAARAHQVHASNARMHLHLQLRMLMHTRVSAGCPRLHNNDLRHLQMRVCRQARMLFSNTPALRVHAHNDQKKHSRTHLFSHMCTRASTVCLLVHNPSYNAHACSSQATTCFNTTRASRARTQQVQALAHAHVNANARTRMLVADACITHSIL